MLVIAEWLHLGKSFDNFSGMLVIHLQNIIDFRGSIFSNVADHQIDGNLSINIYCEIYVIEILQTLCFTQ